MHEVTDDAMEHALGDRYGLSRFPTGTVVFSYGELSRMGYAVVKCHTRNGQHGQGLGRRHVTSATPNTRVRLHRGVWSYAFQNSTSAGARIAALPRELRVPPTRDVNNPFSQFATPSLN